MKSLIERLIPLQNEYDLTYIKLNHLIHSKMQYTIQEYKLKRNTITIYAYHDKTVKKSVKFRDIKGKIIEGYFNFANRITSGNGFLVHDQQGFNSKGGAVKNLEALKRICALMQ